MSGQEEVGRHDSQETPTLVASEAASASSISLRETTQCIACKHWFPSMSQMIEHLSLEQCGLCLCDERILEKALVSYIEHAKENGYENLYGLEYTPRKSPRCKECNAPFLCMNFFFSHLEKEEQCSNSAFSHEFTDYLRRYTTGMGPRTDAEKSAAPEKADLVELDPVEWSTDCPFCHKTFSDEGKQKGRYFRHLEGSRCKAKHIDLDFAFDKYVKCCPLQLYTVYEFEGGSYICQCCRRDFGEFSDLAVHVDNEHTHTSRNSMRYIDDFKFFLHHSKLDWQPAGSRHRCMHTSEEDWDV